MNTSSGFQATIGGKKMRAKKKGKGLPKAKGPTAKGQQMVPANALMASGAMKRKKGKPVMR